MKEKLFVLVFLISLAFIEYWCCDTARQAEPFWTAVYITCANAGLLLFWFAGNGYLQWQARHRDLLTEQALTHWAFWVLTCMLPFLTVLSGALGVIASTSGAYGPVWIEVIIRLAPIMLVVLSSMVLRGMTLLSKAESERVTV